VLHAEVARLRGRLAAIEEERDRERLGSSVPGHFDQERRSANE
jgi:hypothetical protein